MPSFGEAGCDRRLCVGDDQADVPRCSTSPARLPVSREREELVAQVDERHLYPRTRPRRSSGPSTDSRNASASSSEPTSSATWLIPTARVIGTG